MKKVYLTLGTDSFLIHSRLIHATWRLKNKSVRKCLFALIELDNCLFVLML